MRGIMNPCYKSNIKKVLWLNVILVSRDICNKCNILIVDAIYEISFYYNMRNACGKRIVICVHKICVNLFCFGPRKAVKYAGVLQYESLSHNPIMHCTAFYCDNLVSTMAVTDFRRSIMALNPNILDSFNPLSVIRYSLFVIRYSSFDSKDQKYIDVLADRSALVGVSQLHTRFMLDIWIWIRIIKNIFSS